MLLPQFKQCHSSLSIPLPIPNDLIGLENKAEYWVYFLDHVQDPVKANLYELVLLPVPTVDFVEHLYTIRIFLKNRPNATYQALNVLSDLGVDVKHCIATDSIAGYTGMLEASIISQRHNLDQINQAFQDRMPRLGEFVILAQGVETIRTESKGEMRYVIGQKFTDRYPDFRTKNVRTQVRPFVGKLTYPTGDASDDDSKGFLTLEVPSRVLEYLNDQYGQPRDTSLDKYSVAVTADLRFASVSISFLDPGEAIIKWEATIHGNNNCSNVLRKIALVLGRNDVNFRILRAKNVLPETQMTIELYCDLSQTEYQIYSPSTLAWIHQVEITEELAAGPHARPDALKSVKITSEYGYPTERLSHFKHWDTFQILWFRFIPGAPSPHTPLVARSPMDGITDGPWDDLLFRCVDEIANRFEEIIQHDTMGAKPSNQEFMDSFTIEGLKPGIEVVPHDDGPMVVLRWDSRPSPREPTKAGSICISVWIRKTNSTTYCLAFKNVPPVNLQQHFCDAIHIASNQNAMDSRHITELVTSNTLKRLTYEFPKREDFLSRGQKLTMERCGRHSVARFGLLGDHYAGEKCGQDGFPAEGNWELGACLTSYWEEQFDAIDDGRREIILVDIGVASGALTTLFMLERLRRHCHDERQWQRLRDRLRIILIDISKDVLADCKAAMNPPTRIPFRLRGSKRHEIFTLTDKEYVGIFRSDGVHTLHVDATALPMALENKADIVVSGFCHHHMNDEGRRTACAEMARIARPGGFVGVVDESLTFRQYIAYRMNHLRNPEPTADESFLQATEDHVALFKDTGFELRHAHKKRPGDWYYYFWGIKNGQMHRRNLFDGLFKACDNELANRQQSSNEYLYLDYESPRPPPSSNDDRDHVSSPPLPEVPVTAETGHSPDFCEVKWFGTRHTFALGQQSECMRLLWEAWQKGGYGLSQRSIGLKVAPDAKRFELSKVFRGHPTWEKIIQKDQDRHSHYRLCPPPGAL